MQNSHLEDVLEDTPSFTNLSNVKKIPISKGFFRYIHNNLQEISQFHPQAVSLNMQVKEDLDSVRKSFIEPSESVIDIPFQMEGEKVEELVELDNSAMPIAKLGNNDNLSILKKRKTTFSEKVNHVIIPQKQQQNKQPSIDMNASHFTIPDNYKEFLQKILNNNYVVALITLLTLYCLFGDDFRTAFVPKDYDIVFNVISIIAILVFTLEIIISIIVKPNYYLSFFFWLDLLSAISIFLDLVWIQNLIFM